MVQEQSPPIFSQLLLTTTDILNLSGIVRSEIHYLIHTTKLLIPSVASHGKGEKFLLSWEEFAKVRERSKKRKKLKRKVKVFTNAKGGVGKTALATALVHEAISRGYKVLAIDLDPQGQFTYNLGVTSYFGPTIADCLDNHGEIKKNPLDGIAIPILSFFDLVPSCIDLNGLEFLLKNRLGGVELILKKILSQYIDNYDLVVIDTNPYVSLTLANAIMVADHIIIPALTDFNSHMGLHYMERVFTSLFDSPEKRPFVQIVPNGFDPRNNISKESLMSLRDNFKDLVMEPKIRLSTDLTQAHKFQQSVRQYKKSSPVYDDIIHFSDEVLQ